MGARLWTIVVLLSVSAVLAFGSRGLDNPQGWPEWVLAPAAVCLVVAAWLAFVESKHPWGQS